MSLLIDAYWVFHLQTIDFDMLLNTGLPFRGIGTANHVSLFISLHYDKDDDPKVKQEELAYSIAKKAGIKSGSWR